MRLLRVLALVFCLCLASHLRALTVVPPSFEDLVARAEVVVRTEVLGSRCVEKGEGPSRRIVTLVHLRVERVLVGKAPAELEIELLGGTVGEESLEVAGMTQFTKGDRDILFIAHNGRSFCPLVGVNHGRFLLVSGDAGAPEWVARSDASPLHSVAEIRSALGSPSSVVMAAQSLRSAAAASSDAAPARSEPLSRAVFEALILECAAAKGGAK